MGEFPTSEMNSLEESPGASLKVFEDWQRHFQSPAQSTGTALLSSLKSRYLDYNVTVTRTASTGLLAFAKAGNATAELDHRYDICISSREYQPPKGRISKKDGKLQDHTTFGKYNYHWNGRSFIVYSADWMENDSYESNLYILSKSESHTTTPKAVDDLIVASSKWNNELHDEILVFDQQVWQKDKELYKAVQSACWDDVILDREMKDILTKEVESFFDSEEDYKSFAVPWKRGTIFHGTPGNGKTISIKALMHSLASRKDPIPSLYVKSLAGCGNSFYAIRRIFLTAREYSPCLLIFEDLDSLIDDKTKSFFLNEVDGLEDNNGIMMIGSTNYLERLDAGISKRPGRFDRKYHFALPAKPERTAYCEYWRKKLLKNVELEFPAKLCPAIADITENFSFAYMKEVFVTSLLTIVGAQKGTKHSINSLPPVEDRADELEKLLLWRVVKKQIKTLRVEMEGARKSAQEAGPSKSNDSDDDDSIQEL